MDFDEATVKMVLKDIELWHMSGVLMGGACDRGYCECPKIIKHIKEGYGIN